MKYRYAFYLIAALLLAPAATSVAQPVGTPQMARPSNTTGLFVQAHFNGNGITLGDADPERGGGFGFKLGYGIAPFVTLYAGLDVARMKTENHILEEIGKAGYGLGHLDLGVRLNIGGERNALVPYLDAAFSGRTAVLNSVYGGELVYSGGGSSVGGGLKFFVSEVLALDGGVQMTFGGFNEVEIRGRAKQIDMDATTTRLNLGLSWYPFR